MNRCPLRTILLITVLLGAGSAPAHEIWFEPDGAATKLYYGDFIYNMHERSPGGNDRFGQLTAVRLSGSDQQPLKLEKLEDAFRLSVRAGKGESLIAEDRYYRIFEETVDGKVVRSRWTPAARWISDFSAREPVLKLDLVPTGAVMGEEVEFQVFFKGELLPQAPVQMQIAAGWIKEAISDDDGKVRFRLPWKGTYVLRLLRYIEDEPGVRNSEVDQKNPLLARPSATGRERYDRWSHSTTVSFHKRRGLEPLPPVPPTLPASMLAAPATAAAQ